MKQRAKRPHSASNSWLRDDDSVALSYMLYLSSGQRRVSHDMYFLH
jgi:hypothetical protein